MGWVNPIGNDKMTSPSEPYRQCLRSALRILTRRSHSVHEIETKLKLRGYRTATIRDVVSECIRLDYLNDEKAAHQFVIGFKRQGYGPLRIKQKLKAKGIADGLIADALGKHLDAEEQLQVCRRVLAKKIKASAMGLERDQMREKMHRFLFSRGFAPDTIQQVISLQSGRT